MIKYCLLTGPLALWVTCSPLVQETGVQSHIKSNQRLKKWSLMLPCLTRSIISYGSREKWTNPRNAEAPSPTPRCGSY